MTLDNEIKTFIENNIDLIETNTTQSLLDLLIVATDDYTDPFILELKDILLDVGIDISDAQMRCVDMLIVDIIDEILLEGELNNFQDSLDRAKTWFGCVPEQIINRLEETADKHKIKLQEIKPLPHYRALPNYSIIEIN